jgi:hypothetical protein
MVVEINIITGYGKYEWCGNNGAYVYCVNGENELMLNIKMTLTPEFYKKISAIRVLNKHGGDMQYCKLVSLTNTLNFKVDSKYIGETFTIVFGNWKKLNENSLSRGKFITEFAHNFIVNTPTVIGDQTDCAICLAEFTDADKYVGSCGHRFHNLCILSYLDETSKLIKNDIKCTAIKCGHGDFAKKFRCPICDKPQLPYISKKNDPLFIYLSYLVKNIQNDPNIA